MIGIDAVVLWMLVLKFLPLFYVRASVYLYSLPTRFLVFTMVPFLLLCAYGAVSIMRHRRSSFLRTCIIGFLGVFLIGSYLGLQLVARKNTQPYLYIHDGALQTEVAITALRTGQNPYAIDYAKSAFGAFPDTFSQATQPNPAWNHYVYLPFPLLVSAPIASLMLHLGGWFDVRIVYLALFVVLILSLMLLARTVEQRLLVGVLGLFNPYFVQFFIAGFNDVFFLALIALTAVLMQRRRLVWAAIVFGAAIVTKQPAWFLTPFFLTYVYAAAPIGRRWKSVISGAAIVGGAALIAMAPFIIWSPARFFESTIGYAIGDAAASYPISGFGFGQLLVSSGTIRTMWDRYPFWIWQAVLGLPLLVILIRWQLRQNSIARMLFAYAALTTVLLFFSRYFNDSHLGMLSMLVLMAYAASAIEPHATRE